MLAISNRVEYMNQKVIFVAISCVKNFDTFAKKYEGIDKTESVNLGDTLGFNATKVDNKKPIIENDIENLSRIEHKQEQQLVNEKTVIYRINFDSSEQDEVNLYNLKVNKYKEENIGGVVSFVHDKSTFNEMTKTDCFIFNDNGIHRLTFYKNHLKDLKHFNYPRRLMIELNTLNKIESISLIKNCVFDHYFYVEQYKKEFQVMHLYDLRTMQIQQIFNLHEEKRHSNKPILTISKNEQMIAFSSGYGKLALYLIENGLEIASKDFGKNTKIIACEFRDDDELMILIKKSESRYGKMLLWYLYDSSFQLFCNIELGENEENTSYSVRIPGKFVAVKYDGSILSIYDSLLTVNNMRKEVDKYIWEPYSIIIHTDKSMEGTPNKMYELKYENIQSIFYRDSKEDAQPFVYNREPWITNDFERKWVYLDQEELVQLYIGKSTVQVWSQITKNHEFVLEYIWANNVNEDCEDERTLKVLELIVYDRGFSLKVRWDGSIDDQCIQWPCDNNHVIPIKHACNALEHLNYRRNRLVGYDNQHGNYHL